MAVGGWAVTFGTAWTGQGRSPPRLLLAVPNSPPINGQCTNHRIAVHVRCSAVLMCPIKELMYPMKAKAAV